MSNVPNDFPVSELRQVRIEFDETTPSVYLMHMSQVATFMEATLKLHHSPGVNPHNQVKTASAKEIWVTRFDRVGQKSYWWCAPSLQANAAESASLVVNHDYERVWAREDVLARERAERKAELEAEYRADTGDDI